MLRVANELEFDDHDLDSNRFPATGRHAAATAGLGRHSGRALDAGRRFFQHVCDAPSYRMSLEQTIDAALQAIADLAAGSVGAVYLSDSTGKLELERCSGAVLDPEAVLLAAPELVEQAERSKDVTLLSQASAGRAALARLSREDGVIVPLFSQSRHVGALLAFFRRDGGAAQSTTALCRTLAVQISWALERQALEEQVQKAQKLEALGELTGGIAHDFNNVLAAILGYSELVMDGLDHHDPRREDAEQIKVAAERAAALTRQLLAFGRRQALEPCVLDLNAVVSGVTPMLHRLLGEDVHLSTSAAADLALVRADQGQLEQVLLNLVLNARDAMPNGGTIHVETSNLELGPTRSGELRSIPEGRYVRVTVRDGGCGMDTATLARVFEPFFSTKEKGRGTGLGLSVCFGIVKQHLGYIWPESSVGVGSTFTVLLPAAGTSARRSSRPRAEPCRSCGTETILLLEDDVLVRDATARLLMAFGYRVLACSTLQEALRVEREHAEPIDLIVSDVIMPDVQGPDAVAELRKERPGVRVLYMSGFSANSRLRVGELETHANFLHKPFTSEELTHKVRETLDAPEPA